MLVDRELLQHGWAIGEVSVGIGAKGNSGVGVDHILGERGGEGVHGRDALQPRDEARDPSHFSSQLNPEPARGAQ